MSKRLVILGAGESGIGAAILAQKQGFEVFVSDHGALQSKYEKVLWNYDIAFEKGRHSENLILNADEVVKSPGIAESAPIVKALRQAKVSIVSEIEFASRYTDACLIAISGSNGKTTSSLLTYEILKQAGLNVGIAGNVGQSFAWQVAESNYDYYVLEVSNFQLDDSYHFRPQIAALLNITPDHLDRYTDGFKGYIASKFRMVQAQKAEDYFIYNIDDQIIREELEYRNTKSKQLAFGFKHTGREEIVGWVEDKKIRIKLNQEEWTMEIDNLALKGRHNVYNSMVAGVIARVLDIRKPVIRECLSQFTGVEHRLEEVLTVRGVRYINDSKATNINSTWYALESMPGGVIWLAGGVDKGNDYNQLHELVKEKVRTIICIGKDNRKLHQTFGEIVEMIDVDTMENAVRAAYILGEKDNTVLLSPACASFDRFMNYEDRGKQFKTAVKNL